VTLQSRAESFIKDLQSSTMLSHYRARYSSLGLQTRSQPNWLGDPNSADPPVKDPAIFPAVAGVAPKIGTHYKICVKLLNIQMPRFADSCGYPYWIPGGRTNPLIESGWGLGLLEGVSGVTSVGDIVDPIEVFKRVF